MTPITPDLTGKLLLAHPNLHDPSFRRSMVYLVRHDLETGALGFIINRPTDRTFDELKVSGAPVVFAKTKLHFGGPVGTDNLILAMFEKDPVSEKWKIYHTIEIAGEDGEASEITDPSRTIALVGYAGWNPGQLEQEIAGHSWLIHDLDDAAVNLLEADATTWKKLVSQVHPHMALLAEMPDDPKLN